MTVTSPVDEMSARVERLSRELPHCRTTAHEQEVRGLIDKVLDDYLTQIGAHAPRCRCEGCLTRIADSLAARLLTREPARTLGSDPMEVGASRWGGD